MCIDSAADAYFKYPQAPSTKMKWSRALVVATGVPSTLLAEPRQEGIRFRPQTQAPHGYEPLGSLKYTIGWIEWPDYEGQHGRGQFEEADQRSKPN